MSASHFPVVRATAMQAATALARYERHVRSLATTWLDMELYATVSEEIDEVKGHVDLLPGMATRCTSLLISHAALVHALWANGQPGAEDGSADVASRLEEHLECIDALARRCLRLASVVA